jgi:hypothetical protein
MAKYNPGEIISINTHAHHYFPQNKAARSSLMILNVKYYVHKKYTSYECLCLNLDNGNKKVYTFDSRDRDIFKIGEDNVGE